MTASKVSTPASKDTSGTLKQKDIYELNDFCQFHDQEFIENIFLHILRRAVDETGHTHFLTALRQSTLSKERIIAALCYSQEGRQGGIKVRGAKKYHYLNKLTGVAKKTAVLSGLSQLSLILEGLIKIPDTIQYLNQHEYALHNNQDQLRHLEDVQQQLLEGQQQLKIKEQKLQKQLDQLAQEVGRNNAYLLQLQNKITDFIEQATDLYPEIKQNKALSVAKMPLDQIIEEQKHFLDLLYVAFEDRYRGSTEDIRQQVAVYLPYISAVYGPEKPVLDIGCGRGEWLQLLKEHEIKAQGLDVNAVMIAQAQQSQLDVQCTDALEYLKQLPNASLSAVTGMHILEHLEFNYMLRLLQEVLRVLKPNGIAIFETPNPENIFVGAQFFYTDPTHKNPLVPDTMNFLFEYIGYTKTEIKRLHSYAEVSAAMGKPRNLNDDFKNNHFYNAMDFAIIAYKGAHTDFS